MQSDPEALKTQSDGDEDRIAIIGRACRFPGAPDAERFWANLRDGVDAVRFFDAAELAAAGVPAELLRQPGYVPAKAIVDGVELFDAEFFGFTPREAELMDPQQRLFLECAWAACEDAGYDPQTYGGRVGVYAGSGLNSYMMSNLLMRPDVLGTVTGLQARLFGDKDFLTTHVSFKLNLRGPSMAVQTACSTSLVAVHLACQSLLEGECDMALAGGVTLTFPQHAGYLYQDGGVYSPDGRTRAFDAHAQGTVTGEGAGVVVLKRLADALADGDPVYAVILGSAINNDGAAKGGYTAPSVDRQSEVAREALALARIDPATVGSVEAHGSATPLGDPIEVEALTRAYRSPATRPESCALGSVKTNVGHADTAAGVASLIKAIESLRHRQIPPSLHFERPNPAMRLADGPFYVNSALRDWPAGPEPRRAGVHSLGIGGTNAHVVLEEAPAPPAPGPSRPWQLLVLSARTPAALDAATARLARRLEEDPALGGPAFADVAHTLRTGRKAFRHRRVLVCHTGKGREEAVAAFAGGDPALLTGDAGPEGMGERGVAFLFPGLGDHHPGMAAELYEREPVFRAAIDRCAEQVDPHLRPWGVSLCELLYPAPLNGAEGRHPARPVKDLRRLLARAGSDEPGNEEGEAGRRLLRTAFAHPAVFAVEYALAQLWESWGIRPRAMIGYSLGEYVAACLAGVFPLADALDFVAARARLIDRLPAGAMLAVPLPAAELEPLLAGNPDLALSAANGPALSVVGGPEAAVEELGRRLAEGGVACRRLQTSHAFHTPQMEPIVAEFTRLAAGVHLSPPRVPFVSNVTGTWITPEEATDPEYWARHLCRTVRFSDGLETLLAGGGGEPWVLLEVGPGQSLATLARQHPARPAGLVAVASLPDRRDGVSDQAFALEALGRLWLAGAAPDWQGLVRGERRRRVPLPTYPFEHRRYFVDPPAPGTRLAGAAPSSGRLELDQWFWAPSWERLPASAGENASASGHWLLFARDGEALDERLAERLASRGARVSRAVAGPAFATLGDGRYAVDPRNPEDYRALLRALGGAPDGIAHLWNITGEADLQASEAQDLGFYSLLWLAQALGELPPQPIRLAVVADGLHEVTGGERLRPEKATLLGPCRVLPQEYPHLSAMAVDVVAGEPAAALAGSLAVELTAGAQSPAHNPIVALRGRFRWVQRYRPVRLPAPAGPRLQRLRQGGACLVTGALDETVLTVAEHLFRTAGARLALLVPASTPPRGKWAEWLAASDEADETSRALRRLLALEAEGCELLVLPLAQARLDEGVKQARQRFGALHGVIHTAGAPGVGLAQWKTRDMAEAVLAPKVQGTLALAAATAGDPLDLFVLFGASSVATGGFGQIDTCAAASFLDAFAQSRAASGAPFTQAIGWGNFRWLPVVAADPALADQLRAGLAAFGLGPADLAAALDRTLASPLPQVVVVTQDLEMLMAQTDSLSVAAFAPPPATVAAVHPRPELAVAYAAPRDETEAAISRVWEEAFGIERIGVHDNFFDLAGNSLLAIQIVTRISGALGVHLPMASLLESPTVAELAARAAALREPAAPALPSEGEMERLLREIEALAPDEAEAQLARVLEANR